jgi:hypothetical protein
MTVLAFPGSLCASFFIVNWWYTTVDRSYSRHIVCRVRMVVFCPVIRTVNSTSHYTLKTLYRSYFTLSANIELQVYSVTCF